MYIVWDDGRLRTDGTNDILLAMERGEVDGAALAYNSAVSLRPDWVDQHKIRFLLQMGLAKEPTNGWSNAYNLHPVPLTALRKQLFAMLLTSPAEASMAEACLSQIDQLRDEHGQAEFEPRHPDVETDRAWPTAAEVLLERR